MYFLLRNVFDRLVESGDLRVIDSNGKLHRFGDGTGTPVTVRFKTAAAERACVADPQLALGEAYMRGDFIIEDGGRIYEFLALVLSNTLADPMPTLTRGFDALRFLTRRAAQFNPAGRSKRNVAHHYDIDGFIYDLFLDKDRQYSCAYFEPGNDDLEEAQVAKKRHLTAKLAARPGMRVLDIGSGWGGLGLYLARSTGADVTGVTLSEEQLKISRERAKEQRLDTSVRFRLQDYRRVSGPFDRIVSVGMFEHVGVNHYQTFFRKVRDLLTDDGVAVIHSIGRAGTPTATNAFIAKYIFPGGYFPALSEVLPAVERSGLIVTDVEVLRLHYAETLKAWRERFMSHRKDAVQLKGEAFARMWEFYLAGSEAAFRHQGLVVFQLQLAKRIDTVPLTRDYIGTMERRLEGLERGRNEAPRMAGE